MPECPICEANITFPPKTLKGEIFMCPDCDAELEVKATEGGKTGDGVLAEAPKTQEDFGE